MCSVRQNWKEMVKISVTSYENEIHTVDSPSNEDSKSVILCQRDLNFWGGMAGKMQGNVKKLGILLFANEGVVNFTLYSLVSKSL